MGTIDSLRSYGLTSTNVPIKGDRGLERLSEGLRAILSENPDKVPIMNSGYKGDNDCTDVGNIYVDGDCSTDNICIALSYYVYDLALWSKPYSVKSLKRLLNKRSKAFKQSFMPVSTRKKRCTRLANRLK